MGKGNNKDRGIGGPDAKANSKAKEEGSCLPVVKRGCAIRIGCGGLKKALEKIILREEWKGGKGIKMSILEQRLEILQSYANG